jgi:PAS domain S-box-containing protein
VTELAVSPETAALFAGDSELAQRCRALDWSATSLGPVDTWPTALRTAVRMALECPFPINMWCGPDLLLIYNDAYRDVLGIKHPASLGRPGREVWGEIWPDISPMFDAIRTGGAPIYAENARFMMERESGPPREAWFTFSLSPIRDESGDVIAFLNVATETTTRVRARHDVERLWEESEQARANVQASEARYRFLANAIPVQVWTATPDGRLDYVSDLTAKYFGKAPNEVTGDGWLGVLHPDDIAATAGRWEQSLASGAPYEVEFRLWSAAHGSHRWHLARATAQRDEHGTIIRWFGTNTEIEEQKRAASELQRLTMEALEANRAKGDFLAAMSHELRTPLNAIGGYAQLIEMGLRGPVTEEQRVDLLKIQRSKNHLDGLVSDVLNFAKLGSGKLDFRVRPISVRQTLDAVIEMVAPQLVQKALHLEPYAAPNDGHVLADVDRTRQILLNLFANALKFTASGGTITPGVRMERDVVTISVRDTGIGIPAEQLDRIFEPFVQARRSLDPKDHGFGLGLAISRQLARAMGGDVTVRSEVGRGSTFTLTLPRS